MTSKKWNLKKRLEAQRECLEGKCSSLIATGKVSRKLKGQETRFGKFWLLCCLNYRMSGCSIISSGRGGTKKWEGSRGKGRDRIKNGVKDRKNSRALPHSEFDEGMKSKQNGPKWEQWGRGNAGRLSSLSDQREQSAVSLNMYSFPTRVGCCWINVKHLDTE